MDLGTSWYPEGSGSKVEGRGGVRFESAVDVAYFSGSTNTITSNVLL